MHIENNLLLSEDGNKQFEDAASISHNISFDIFDACMVGFYRAKFQKLIDQELKPLDIPIDDFISSPVIVLFRPIDISSNTAIRIDKGVLNSWVI